MHMSNNEAFKMRHTLVGRDYRFWQFVKPLIKSAFEVSESIIVFINYAAKDIQVYPFEDSDLCYESFQNLCIDLCNKQTDQCSLSFPYRSDVYDETYEEGDLDFGTGFQVKDSDGSLLCTGYMYNPEYYYE